MHVFPGDSTADGLVRTHSQDPAVEADCGVDGCVAAHLQDQLDPVFVRAWVWLDVFFHNLPLP